MLDYVTNLFSSFGVRIFNLFVNVCNLIGKLLVGPFDFLNQRGQGDTVGLEVKVVNSGQFPLYFNIGIGCEICGLFKRNFPFCFDRIFAQNHISDKIIPFFEMEKAFL